MKKYVLLWLCFLSLTLHSAKAEDSFLFFEAAYPHYGVYQTTDSVTGEESLKINPDIRAPWRSHWMPYFWETKAPYAITEALFSELPEAGWVQQQPYPEMGIQAADVLRKTDATEPVTKVYRPFGWGNFRVVQKNRVCPAESLYQAILGTWELPDDSALGADRLSQKNADGSYVVSDEQIAKCFPLYESAYLVGRNYAKGGEMTIDIANEILLGKAQPNQFDADILRKSERQPEISWEIFYEGTPPHLQYEILSVDGLLLDGRTENGVTLPYIYRYNGLSGQTERALQSFETAQIYVFTYHWISENPDNWGEYTITPQKFHEDVRWLYENGYTFLTASELAQMNGQYPSDKLVLLTFDDGYASCYTEALPILEQYGAKATMFLVGSYLNEPDYLTDDQLWLLSKSPLVELGNHSYQLHNTKKANVLGKYYNQVSQMLSDYYQNEERITGITSQKLTSLSYPYGVYTARLEADLRAHGYEVTLSTRAGTNHNTRCNTPLKRLNRSYYQSVQDLIQSYQNQ